MSPLAELSQIVASGRAMLFTGAGFSSDARAVDGERIPDSPRMIRDLWTMCFGGGEPDESSLADLYDVALQCAPDQLRRYVTSRLRVGDDALPAHLAAWFGAPWRQIYTLNVDDVEAAVQRQFRLPRRLRSVSAFDRARPAPEPGILDVVHLNGMAGDDPRELTFSTMQYAARLCRNDLAYEQLAADLTEAPFVFAGTTLDEVILWQHLERHRRRDGREITHQPGFLIARSLPRARQILLRNLRIEWVPATIAEISEALPS